MKIIMSVVMTLAPFVVVAHAAHTKHNRPNVLFIFDLHLTERSTLNEWSLW